MSLNPDRAYDQFKHLLAPLGIKRLADLRPLTYGLNFVVPGSADLNVPSIRSLPQQFPAGALVLGVKGACTPEGQPQNAFMPSLDRFQIRLSYNTSDGLIPQFVTGSAIFGQMNDQFPQRALFLEAQQVAQTEILNLTPDQIRVSISFHCLVWRYAQ